MTRKAPTLSEKAYNALDRAKGKNKSPTKVVRSLTRMRSKGSLLEYVRSTAPNYQLADRIEKVLKKRNGIHLRTARVNAVQKRQITKAAHQT
jgi:hypothetical protein